METYKKVAGQMMKESSSMGEIVPTELDYVGGTFQNVTGAGANTYQMLQILSVGGPLAGWKKDSTRISIKESGLYQIFITPPAQSTADQSYMSAGIVANYQGEDTVLATQFLRWSADTNYEPSVSWTGVLENGMDIYFSFASSIANKALDAGGSFFIVRIQEKYPKVLFDSARMPQHFMGPPDLTTETLITDTWGSGGDTPHYIMPKDGYLRIAVSVDSTDVNVSGIVAFNHNSKSYEIIKYNTVYAQSSMLPNSVFFEIEVRKDDEIWFGITHSAVTRRLNVRFYEPQWVLPVFVAGADLQSSNDPGYCSIEPDTKRIKMNGGGGGGITQFTYVVDSNEKLAAWANNEAGNDYSSVLIAPGTWESNKGVNLTAAGTKVVVGMPGSVLKLTLAEDEFGLYYTNLPTGPYYRMEDLEIYLPGSAQSIAFNKCINISNCRCRHDLGIESGVGFNSCENIYHSIAITMNNGFSNCKKLVNCIGTGSGKTSPYNSGIAFVSCSKLLNCKGDVSGIDNSYNYGFYLCNDLINCEASASSRGNDGQAKGFFNCKRLTGCSSRGQVEGSHSYAGVGYDTCSYLTDCSGSGSGTAYAGCKGMIRCGKDFSSPVIYNGCFVSPSGTGPAPSDSAEGGWNLS
ncbi:MAG: hypothetical protein LBP76_10970 [Treponema sp.]|nr:hypothetical protein [Treponema sp.]